MLPSVFFALSASQTLFYSGYSGGVLARIVQLYTHTWERQKIKNEKYFSTRVCSLSLVLCQCVCAREYSLSNLSFSMYLTVSSVFHYSLVRYSRALLLPTPLLLSSRVTPLSRSRSKVSPVIVLLFNFFSLKCFKQFLYSVCVLSIAACCFSTIPPCVCAQCYSPSFTQL